MFRKMVVVLALLTVVRFSHAERIAYYRFDEGPGAIARDSSGKGNDGAIYNGPASVRNGDGFALQFDGADDWINVPWSSSLDRIKTKGSLMLWYKVAEDAGFPGILTMKVAGANWPDMRLTLFVRNDEHIFTYISNGKDYACSAGPCVRDAWTHYAATWDGARLKTYVNGALAGDNPCAYGPDITNVPLWIGRTEAITTPGFFKGQMDELAIYDEALDDASIRKIYQEGIPGSAKPAPLPAGAENAAPPKSEFPMDYRAKVTDVGALEPVNPAATLEKGGWAVKVALTGDIELDGNGDAYVIESCFSYPGPDRRIGWNGLPRGFGQQGYPLVAKQLGSETGWKPAVRREGADAIVLEAQGDCYRLRRTLRLADGRLDVDDEFVNLRNEPTGVVPRHRITARENYLDRYTVNQETACQPSIFLAGTHSSLGVLMQDDVSRRRLSPYVPVAGNRAGFQIERVALDKGKSRTFSWSVYLLKGGEGYFDFINRARVDWNANFAIQGPFAFAYIDDVAGNFRIETSSIQWKLEEIRKDPARFRDYLKWKKIGIMAIAPWVDYDPGSWGHVFTREELKPVMRKLVQAMKEAAPEVRLVGCIETDWVTIPLDRTQIKGGDKLPRQAEGLLSDELSPEQIQIIEEALSPWKDSFIRTANGKLFLECYKRGGKWVEPAVRVYPEVGNYHYEFIKDQVRFLLDEIGTDGVYFDEFSLGVIGSHRTYLGRWDGISAEINFTTGEIYAPYVDCGLASNQARVNLVKELLARGKTVVANFYSTSREEQSLPVNRFAEQGWGLSKMTWGDGTKPPATNYMFFGHLNSPIGLGIYYTPAGQDPARQLVRALTAYLRHGMVMYYNVLTESPREGPGSFEYGVVNHMFPITPVKLGEGFIVGKERILTAVSTNTLWEKNGKPEVLFFDMTGRATDAAGRYEVKPENGQWRVILRLKDWTEIAVVE